MSLSSHVAAARKLRVDPLANLRAIGLMVLAMALLALTDMFIKLSAQTLPIGQIMIMMSVGGTTLFCLLAAVQRKRLIDRAALHPMVLWRNLFEITGAIGMTIGTAYVPLSIVAAVMQTAPLVVVLGAAFILKEQVGPRRWMAVFVGLCGMLLVVRPGMEGFTPAVVFTILGVTSLALRDLVTRLCPPGIPSVTLSTWGFAATIPGALLLAAFTAEPPRMDTTGIYAVLGAVTVTTAGYYAITTAMRMAPVSIVAPFRYARLLFTTGLGIAVFGERPDALTLLGGAIILAAGLYTFFRERQIARADRRQA